MTLTLTRTLTLQEHSEEEFEKLQDEFNWHYYSEEDQQRWEEWVFKKLTLLSGLGRPVAPPKGVLEPPNLP